MESSRTTPSPFARITSSTTIRISRPANSMMCSKCRFAENKDLAGRDPFRAGPRAMPAWNRAATSPARTGPTRNCADVDEAAWSSIYSNLSRPFPKPQCHQPLRRRGLESLHRVRRQMPFPSRACKQAVFGPFRQPVRIGETSNDPDRATIGI